MSRTPIRPPEFYQALPKVELHRHLEGSLRLETMLEIASSNDLDIPTRDPDELRSLVQVMPGETRDHRTFLSKFTTLRKFFVSAEVIRRVTQETVIDAAADNVSYLELRFTPVALANLGKLPLADVINLVIGASHEAAGHAGIQVRLIASFNRHESMRKAEKVVALAADFSENGIAGLDVAGDEANFPADPFAALLNEARQSGLKLTVHAGEWGGPANVQQAISLFRADRIGHGVRVLEDAGAVELALERGTVFEVCPTSNIHSGVFAALKDHPLKRMTEAGLATTINTDDPGISNIRLTDEYMLAGESLSIAPAGLRAMTLTAARAAFLRPSERAALIEAVGEAFDRALELHDDPG